MSVLQNIVNAVIALFGGQPLSQAQLSDVLDRKAAATGEKLDWRHSIVDLMKTAGLDSSLQARETLASELGYQGSYNGSAEMNMFLHEKVMERLAQSLS